ncbi:uncharacterized protein GGS25DRAFT_511227 [Hypoxylon fragiforme]|uniref:uncharacterized protein n=1 Tax=Hypoxylon fragiforme TaxID=63214 RepID=UPI0020C5D61E|nr:uncharacterized protein GGS25DRAFT_511227 [Hypoxylon fragiforme]KAI2603404.1 hypothetical protein GGS25DRAFT_511227 [Hypoxylon fragiforme]
MKTFTTLASLMLGLCLTGVQASLPYEVDNVEWRRSPPPAAIEAKLPHPTGTYPASKPFPHHTGGPHHTMKFVTKTGTGHAYPTGHLNKPTLQKCNDVSECKNLVCPTVLDAKKSCAPLLERGHREHGKDVEK